MVSLPLHFVFPPQFCFFLTASSFQLNCSSIGRAGRTPSGNKGIKCLSLPYLPGTRLQKVAVVSLPLHFILFFSPFRFFSHNFLFPKLLISRPHRSPSLSQLRDQGPSLPHLPATRLQKGAAVSLPLLFIFPPTILIFSHSFFFPISVLFSWPCQPPSLSQ